MGVRKYNRRHHASPKLKRNTKTREQHVFNSLHAESGKNTAWELGQHCSFSLAALVICPRSGSQTYKSGRKRWRGSSGERRVGDPVAQGQDEAGEALNLLPPGLGHPRWSARVLRSHTAQVTTQVVPDRFRPPGAERIPAPVSFAQRKDAGTSLASPACLSSGVHTYSSRSGAGRRPPPAEQRLNASTRAEPERRTQPSLLGRGAGPGARGGRR